MGAHPGAHLVLITYRSETGGAGQHVSALRSSSMLASSAHVGVLQMGWLWRLAAAPSHHHHKKKEFLKKMLFCLINMRTEHEQRSGVDPMTLAGKDPILCTE